MRCSVTKVADYFCKNLTFYALYRLQWIHPRGHGSGVKTGLYIGCLSGGGHWDVPKLSKTFEANVINMTYGFVIQMVSSTYEQTGNSGRILLLKCKERCNVGFYGGCQSTLRRIEILSLLYQWSRRVGLDSEKRLFLRKDAKRCEKRQNNGKRGSS